MMPVPAPIPVIYPPFTGVNYMYPVTQSPDHNEAVGTASTVPSIPSNMNMTTTYSYPMMQYFGYGDGTSQVPMVMGPDGLMYPLSNYVNDGTYPSSNYSSPSRPHHRMSSDNGKN